MEVSPYELALIGGGFTIAGTFAGSFITYRFALILGKIEAKRQAGRRLIDAFSMEMATLNPNLDIYPGAIKSTLINAFEKHRKAMIEYAFYLEGAEKAEYERKCKKYFSMVSPTSIFNDYQNAAGCKMFHADVLELLKNVEP